MAKIRKFQPSAASPALKDKTILLGITGSISVYKSCEIVRRIQDEGANVYCLMTEGAQKFVTSLTFSALSGHPVATEIWDESLWKMAHLELAGKADLYVIAPASCNMLAKLAGGFSDEVVSATASATKAPILIAPAMHERMWLHPATQSNVKRLKSYGYHFVGPDFGALARGDRGWGRLAEAQSVIAAIKKILR